MYMLQNLNLPQKFLDDFCRRHHIRKLSFFGSVLRKDFNQSSDVDVLVEFESMHIPRLIGLAKMELELFEILGGKLQSHKTC
jgi:uncharacterized protein